MMLHTPKQKLCLSSSGQATRPWQKKTFLGISKAALNRNGAFPLLKVGSLTQHRQVVQQPCQISTDSKLWIIGAYLRTDNWQLVESTVSEIFANRPIPDYNTNYDNKAIIIINYNK